MDQLLLRALMEERNKLDFWLKRVNICSTPFSSSPFFEKWKSESIVNNENLLKKEYSTGITEAITKGDPRETRVYDAKRKKLQALSERGPWNIIFKKGVQHNANILGGRFLLAI